MITFIENDPNIADWLIAIGEIGQAIAAFIVVFYGIYQIKQFTTQLSNDSSRIALDTLRIVLEIENQINARKVELDKASKSLREADLDSDFPSNQKSILADYFDSMKENYFNSLERLSFCIVKGYVPERDWKTEYRNMLKDTIKEFEDNFGPASPYKNIVKLNYDWQNN